MTYWPDEGDFAQSARERQEQAEREALHCHNLMLRKYHPPIDVRAQELVDVTPKEEKKNPMITQKIPE